MSTATRRAPQVGLRVADLRRSLAFYCHRLGFPMAGSDTKAAMACVTGPGTVPLLLFEESADLSRWPEVPLANPGAWVYLYQADLPSLATKLAADAIAHKGPIAPYQGYRHLLVPDPDGYEIAFWESLPLTDPQILDLYASGPQRLQAAVAGLTEADLDLLRAPGKWSIRQIVHHLVDSELATFHILQLALALPGRQVQADVWEPDQWGAGLAHHRRPIGPAVSLFIAVRAWMQEAVASLDGALDRQVRWPSGYQAAVRDLLRQTGGHALHHIVQVEETRRLHHR